MDGIFYQSGKLNSKPYSFIELVILFLFFLLRKEPGKKRIAICNSHVCSWKILRQSMLCTGKQYRLHKSIVQKNVLSVYNLVINVQTAHTFQLSSVNEEP